MMMAIIEQGGQIEQNISFYSAIIYYSMSRFTHNKRFAPPQHNSANETKVNEDLINRSLNHSDA